MQLDEMARFWAKVGKSETCWYWLGALDRGGYGAFRPASSRRMVKVHRFAYERLVGSIPGGLTIDHLCRVRHCVNPAHMEAVTQSVNASRGTRRELAQCGHPLVVYGGRRRCKPCSRAQLNKYQNERRRAAGAVPGGSGARQRAKTHCIHGHEYTAENTGRDTRGRRYCLACAREAARQRRARARLLS